MKICDLTQFYSPVSGGVRRYVEQKVAFVRKARPDCQHILVVPGEATTCTGDDISRVYTIASPLISRTSRYRALLKLHLVEEVLEREKPDIIESGDPYQLAWKAIASGRGLDIPVVGFYHSHFPEAYIRSVAKYFGSIAIAIAEDASRRYVRTLYNSLERTFVPSPVLASLLREWGVERVVSIDLGEDAAVCCPNGGPCRVLRRELRIPDDRRLLLYVGRLASEKNVRTLLGAFEILHRKMPARRRGWRAQTRFGATAPGNQVCDLAAILQGTGRVGFALPHIRPLRSSWHSGDLWTGHPRKSGMRDARSRHPRQLHGPYHLFKSTPLGSRKHTLLSRGRDRGQIQRRPV